MNSEHLYINLSSVHISHAANKANVDSANCFLVFRIPISRIEKRLIKFIYLFLRLYFDYSIKNNRKILIIKKSNYLYENGCHITQYNLSFRFRGSKITNWNANRNLRFS